MMNMLMIASSWLAFFEGAVLICETLPHFRVHRSRGSRIQKQDIFSVTVTVSPG
jgi:hypothetical protein